MKTIRRDCDEKISHIQTQVSEAVSEVSGAILVWTVANMVASEYIMIQVATFTLFHSTELRCALLTASVSDTMKIALTDSISVKLIHKR